jgi:hypothetical protein
VVAAADFGAAVAQYLVDWVEVARDFHGIQIDLLGFHNESPWQVAWFLRLREELDARGLAAVKLVAADCGPGPGFRKPCWLLHIAAQRSACYAQDVAMQVTRRLTSCSASTLIRD